MVVVCHNYVLWTASPVNKVVSNCDSANYIRPYNWYPRWSILLVLYHYQGFRIIDKHSIKPAYEQNHASAYHHRAQVEKELLDQIHIGHYIIADRKPAVVSAMAAIPKEMVLLDLFMMAVGL